MRVDVERYLEDVGQRLHQDGFSCSRDVNLEEWQPVLQSALARLRMAGLVGRSADPGEWRLDLLARRTESYALSRLEEVFFLSLFASLDLDGLMGFLAGGVAIAQATRMTPGKPMGVFCVALVDDPDDLAVEEAEWGNHTADATSQAMPVPVVLDVRHGQLHFFQQMPVFNSYLVNLLRELIHKYLLPGAQPSASGSPRS
jgi:hypothetical protein